MADSKQPVFDPHAFLLNAGLGKRLVHLKAKKAFFLQGDVADSVFYVQKGRAKLTVVSGAGKEATITLLAPGEFVGEEAIAAVAGNRDHGLHGVEDRQKGDDSRDPRGACLLRSVPRLLARSQYADTSRSCG